MDINKLSMPEKIISASGLVLVVASFLPWFKIGGVNWNGWDTGFLWGGIPTLLGIAMMAHVLISNFASNVTVPDLPWPRIHMIGGIVAAALVVLKLLIGAEAGGLGVTIDLDRAFGLFLAAIAAIGLGVGGFLYNKEKTGTTTTM